MKRIFTFLSLIILCLSGIDELKAQKIDYNEIILPDKADSMVLSALGLSLFEEKLVQLAWKNYPASEIYASRIRIAEKTINLERFNWTDDIQARFSFNQQNLLNNLQPPESTTDEEGNVSVGFLNSWYNFGLTVSLGSFVKTPIKTSIAKEQLNIAKADLNQQKISIRAEVLKRYKEYQLKIELLKIRTQAAEDAYSTHLLITRDFENGVATLEEFINSASAYNEALENKLVAQKEVLEAKITIEEMTGVKFEEVSRN